MLNEILALKYNKKIIVAVRHIEQNEIKYISIMIMHYSPLHSFKDRFIIFDETTKQYKSILSIYER